jgi:hypothetical protein
MTVKFNRQTSGESTSLPQYLGCNAVFDMRLRVSQCRLIPYLHQRPIFFKANSIHSSIVAILELIRGAQYLIEVIRSSGEEMWHVDAYQIPHYSRGIEEAKRTHPRFADWTLRSYFYPTSLRVCFEKYWSLMKVRNQSTLRRMKIYYYWTNIRKWNYFNTSFIEDFRK